MQLEMKIGMGIEMARMAWYDTSQISILETAIEESDWFTAVVLSATQLERHGYLATKDYLKSLKVNRKVTDKILKRIHLYEISEYLLAIGKIDNKEHRTIVQLNEERNKFLHRRETKRYARGIEATKKYEPLVKEAIRILKEKFNVVRLYVSKG